MSPSQQLNVDSIIEKSHDQITAGKGVEDGGENLKDFYTYAGRYGTTPLPKHHLANKGISADAAYRIIHDELALDGSTVLNLASFVHTWMPPQADKLFQENISKNLIDADEYPATQLVHMRCVSILASLWNAPDAKDAVGTATTGSSEAIELGGLAMKKLWQQRMKAAGKNIHEPGPNIVMGANAQVALEKFARYFDVECRLVPVSAESHYRLDPKKAMEYVDENTIGVFVILGSTYTGHYESVKEMSDLLDEYEKRTGIYVPIHADAASGGFIAPFVSPGLLWDFRLPRVVSINASGHKFGLSYVGVGWAIWRDKQHLPKDLIFELRYLGSVQHSFSLNFSRPAAPIIAQYFNLIHLGFEGYRAVALGDLRNARFLSRALENTGYFEVISDVHRAVGAHTGGGIDADQVEAYEPGLPVVAFRLTPEFQQKHPTVQQRWVHILLRAKGWIIPNYHLPPNVEKEQILRVVIRENISEVLIDQLIADIVETMHDLITEAPSEETLKIVDSAQNKGVKHHHKVKWIHFKEGEAPKASGTYNHIC